MKIQVGVLSKWLKVHRTWGKSNPEQKVAGGVHVGACAEQTESYCKEQSTGEEAHSVTRPTKTSGC